MVLAPSVRSSLHRARMNTFYSRPLISLCIAEPVRADCFAGREGGDTMHANERI
jgi:hypothetical protein